MFHFNISQHQQDNNLLIVIITGILLTVTLFVRFCLRQRKKPIYDYRTDTNSGIVCYRIEKRSFIIYTRVKDLIFFERHDAAIKVAELNSTIKK